MPIVSYSGTGYYPPFVRDIINASWDLGTVKATAYETKLNAAQSTFLDNTNAPHISATQISAVTVDEPTVAIPSNISTDDIIAKFDTKYAGLIAELANKFASFRTTYFPNEEVTYAAAKTWIDNALANPNNAIPVTVRDQILTQGRESALEEAARASDEVLQTFAGKRFALPPGAAASAVIQINQTAMDNVSKASRELGIQQIEMQKFVLDKVGGHRELSMKSAIDYIQALVAGGLDQSAKVVGLGYDAQTKLISSASQFYNSRTAAKELVSKVNQFNASATQAAAEKNQMADLTIIEDKLKALLSEAQGIAQMATSLFNNIHASAGVTASDSVSTSL